MAYGNDNLMFVRGCQFIVTDGTSDPGITLDKNTTALTLYATQDTWVNIGVGTPVAVAPAEKAASNGSFFVPASGMFSMAVPVGSDAYPLVLAAIAGATGGNLYIYQRSDV
jgi:hypothetical protein